MLVTLLDQERLVHRNVAGASLAFNVDAWVQRGPALRAPTPTIIPVPVLLSMALGTVLYSASANRPNTLIICSRGIRLGPWRSGDEV